MPTSLLSTTVPPTIRRLLPSSRVAPFCDMRSTAARARALQTGITYSLRQGAKYIVTFDADGQHQMSDLAAILAPILSGEADVSLGSRFLSQSSNVPPMRRVLLRAARLFTWATSGVYLTDCHNGFRAFSRRAAEKIHLKQDRMAHASELYDQIRAARLRYKEVPVSIRYTRRNPRQGAEWAELAINPVSISLREAFAMTPFQWIFVLFCAVQLLLSLRRLRRSRHLFHLAFALMWLGGVVVLVDPDISVRVAAALGIGRGVDLAFYVLCILFLWAHYQHYARYKRTEDSITTLVRELAIQREGTAGTSNTSLDGGERS